MMTYKKVKEYPHSLQVEIEKKRKGLCVLSFRKKHAACHVLVPLRLIQKKTTRPPPKTPGGGSRREVVADAFLVMIMDGAGWHTANDLQIPETMYILYLPPYSPELNPIEHLWDDLREKDFWNRVFATIEALEIHLMHSQARLENDHDRVQHLTGWDWIVDAILNAN